jgi:phosphoribosylformylglycinamidine synthase
MATNEYVAKVYVVFKTTVNDPEGSTIAGALKQLGFDQVRSVRAGRFFQVRLHAPGDEAARAAVDDMCKRLLANPVIETYPFEVEPAS